MLGLAGSNEPAARPVSVSGIGSVRTGIFLRCACAEPAAARKDSTISPAATRFNSSCFSMAWWGYFNQVR
jgi:hypothetical protein